MLRSPTLRIGYEPSYAYTVKLVEDDYFHWEFNMRMKLSRKGLLPHIVKPEYDELSDRSTAEWKTNDLKALGVIAGDVSLTYQVCIRGATSAADAWRLLEKRFNRNTLKNRLLVTKKLPNFKMEPGTRFAHVDRFKELVLQLEAIGESLDEARQPVLLLGSLTDEYRKLSTVPKNTPNVTLAYAIQPLAGIETSDEVSSAQQKAFLSKRDNGKRKFNGKCFFCKKTGHKETDCCKKKADAGRGQVAQEQASDFVFTAASMMATSEWLVVSGASSPMTSVRDKFESMEEPKTPVQITIADGTKIVAVAKGTVGMKLTDRRVSMLCGGVQADNNESLESSFLHPAACPTFAAPDTKIMAMISVFRERGLLKNVAKKLELVPDTVASTDDVPLIPFMKNWIRDEKTDNALPR